MISVLLVAPVTNLESVDSEVQSIVNLSKHLSVHLVRRPCAAHDVLTAIDNNRRFDAVHIAAHGGPDGVHLDDGLWAVSSIVQAVVMCYAKLLYLSTCDGVAVAKHVSELTHSDVIATLAEQGDKRAAELATNFWRTIAREVAHPPSAYLRTARHDNNSIYVRSLLD